MRVFVINLERSAARRAAIGASLGALGVGYELFPGVEGAAGHECFDACDVRQYLLNTGRTPSDHEVGCYASHARLWAACVAAEEPFAILEDDAAPLPTFAAALDVTRRLIHRYGFIRLEYDGPSHPARTRETESAGAFSVHYSALRAAAVLCSGSAGRIGLDDRCAHEAVAHGRPAGTPPAAQAPHELRARRVQSTLLAGRALARRDHGDESRPKP